MSDDGKHISISSEKQQDEKSLPESGPRKSSSLATDSISKILDSFQRGVRTIWKYSGLAYIAAKATSSENKEHHPTLVLWMLGLYVAVFGLASQRYENHLDRLENKANMLVAQTSSSTALYAALSRVSSIQQIEIPQQPIIFNPYSVWCSLLCEKKPDRDNINVLRDVLISFKSELIGLYLEGVDLRGVRLSEANFTGANFSEAKLSGAQ